MPIKRRIFFSLPGDQWLSDKQNDFKWGLVEEIEKWGYAAEIFTDPTGREGLAAGRAWSAVDALAVMKKCIGAVLIGLPRWSFTTDRGTTKLPTDYCHYEGAMAYTLGLPVLVTIQKDVLHRVVFDHSYKGQIAEFPDSADRSWLNTKNFQVPLQHWKRQLDDRRDIFLGYCSGSTGTAKKLKAFFTDDAGVKVLDWQTDLQVAGNILEQIGEAASRCSAGIFLFTGDDTLTDEGKGERIVTRDNVVFEAGYFIHAKGKGHILIVRETGVKLPADLGGDIYVPLQDRSDIGPIKELLHRFVNNL